MNHDHHNVAAGYEESFHNSFSSNNSSTKQLLPRHPPSPYQHPHSPYQHHHHHPQHQQQLQQLNLLKAGSNHSSVRKNRRKLKSNPEILNNNLSSHSNQKRSTFVRQDSGLSDCSDHSGISLHSGVSSISSVGQSRRSTTNNSGRRNMYNRQDSEHSFSSASSFCSGNSTYSSDASYHSNSSQNSGKFMHNYKKPVMPPKSQYVAVDCEMVGTLTGKSACARVVLVDWKGRTVLDEYVKPDEPVTDYRTFVSGITQDQLENAPPLEEIRPRVHSALAGKIVIGHGLSNDLECLGVDHPWHMIRDTALYEPFMKMHYGQLNPRKLKELAQERLNREIQVPGKPHSPIEDAMAALDLYKSHRPRWEACMTAQIKEGQRLLVEQQKQREQYEQYFAGLPILAFP